MFFFLSVVHAVSISFHPLVIACIFGWFISMSIDLCTIYITRHIFFCSSLAFSLEILLLKLTSTAIKCLVKIVFIRGDNSFQYYSNCSIHFFVVVVRARAFESCIEGRENKRNFGKGATDTAKSISKMPARRN